MDMDQTALLDRTADAREGLAVPETGWQRAVPACPSWPAEALEFFDGLEAANTRARWSSHRKLGDTAVLERTQLLLAARVPTSEP